MESRKIEIFTIGYQSHNISSFINKLSVNAIELLADIREKPYSRLKDFSRQKLASHLKQAGIEYRHYPQLGSPQMLRDKVRKDHDYGHFFTEYKKYLTGQSNTLDDLLNLAINNTLCLLCFEKDPAICHRGCVAERLQILGGSSCKIKITNL